MSASQHCHARGYTRARYLVVLILSCAASAAFGAEPPAPDCEQAERGYDRRRPCREAPAHRLAHGDLGGHGGPARMKES